MWLAKLFQVFTDAIDGHKIQINLVALPNLLDGKYFFKLMNLENSPITS